MEEEIWINEGENSCPNLHTDGSDRSTAPDPGQELIPAEIEESLPYTRKFCMGKRSLDQTGGKVEFCQRPAGWGTDHAGAGYCKLHGGAMHNHGIAHKKYTSQISAWKDIYEEYLNDPELIRISPEIAKLRTLIHRFEADHFESKTTPVDIEIYDSMIKLLDVTTKAVRRADEIRKRNEYTFTIDQVREFVTEFTLAMRDLIDDPAKWDQIMEKIEQITIRRNQKGRSGNNPSQRFSREERIWEGEETA